MPKSAPGLSAVQVQPLTAGSGTRQLWYCSKGRGWSGPGQDGADWMGQGSQHWQCWKAGPRALPSPWAWHPWQGSQAPQFPHQRGCIGFAPPTVTQAPCGLSWTSSSGLVSADLWKPLMNQEWIFPVFSRSAWQTQKMHSQLASSNTDSELLCVGSFFCQGTHTSALVLGILPAL